MTMKVNVKLPTYAKELGKGMFMAMGMKLYSCRKCGMTVQSDRMPSGSCPAGGSHNWAVTYL